MSNPQQQETQAQMLVRLANMREPQTPRRNLVEKKEPTAPIKDNGGKVAVFTHYVENPVSKQLCSLFDQFKV
jgi:hypothetical protein